MPPVMPPREYQPNLGRVITPAFMAHKAPRWRVRGLEDLSDADRIALAAGIRSAVALLPFQPLDIELVGSYVLRQTHARSDIDVCLAVPDDMARSAFRQLDGGARWRNAPDFTEQLHQVQWTLGIRIDVAAGFSNRASGIPCFSLNEGRFYGKLPGQVIDHRYRRVRETDRFVPAPLLTLHHNSGGDPWQP